MSLEQEIKISLPDGQTEAVFLRPDGDGAWPGILYLTDIGGIRPAQRQMAQRLANEGYAVLMPNVFYRVAQPPVMDMALRANPELFMKRVHELAEPLTPEAIDRDARGYVDFLTDQHAVKDKKKLGVVGFCICGGIAMRVAAAWPDRIAACASFHGGGLYEDKPASPHLLLPKIRARLLFGHAVNDRSMPAEAIEKFETALESCGGEFESETYEGASHGWTSLDSPVYNRAQAERAYGKLRGLFSAVLR